MPKYILSTKQLLIDTILTPHILLSQSLLDLMLFKFNYTGSCCKKKKKTQSDKLNYSCLALETKSVP